MTEVTSKVDSQSTATFAGGCFWCLEPAFAQLKGIKDLSVGYTGESGKVEALQVKFDPSKISYPELLETFWRQIDPTDVGGQFYDRGEAYQTAIFYHSEQQKKLAEDSKEKLDKTGIFPGPIVTKILPAFPFKPAEDFHQGYCKKNPLGYKMFSWGSGRKPYLKKIWDDKK